LNCLCANTDVLELFGPKLRSGRSLETENTVHDYVKDLTRKFEYPLEVHKVISDQGYILTLHRLPFGRKASNITKRPRSTVLLNLGLFGSPESFLFRGPQHDLRKLYLFKMLGDRIRHCSLYFGRFWIRHVDFEQQREHLLQTAHELKSRT
ncbi:hypothetical protein AMK59_7877, partial [Oryctes borbonicus]